MISKHNPDEGVLKFIANNCPKIYAKLQGKITRGAVLHTEITRILEKPDCNVTEIELSAWEDTLDVNEKQLELDLRVPSKKKAAPMVKKASVV